MENSTDPDKLISLKPAVRSGSIFFLNQVQHDKG